MQLCEERDGLKFDVPSISRELMSREYSTSLREIFNDFIMELQDLLAVFLRELVRDITKMRKTDQSTRTDSRKSFHEQVRRIRSVLHVLQDDK